MDTLTYGITTAFEKDGKASPVAALAAKIGKTLLALAVALAALGVCKPTTAYAWTGTRTLSFQTGGGWTTPSVTLRQSKSTSQLRSLFRGRTTTK